MISAEDCEFIKKFEVAHSEEKQTILTNEGHQVLWIVLNYHSPLFLKFALQIVEFGLSIYPSLEFAHRMFHLGARKWLTIPVSEIVSRARYIYICVFLHIVYLNLHYETFLQQLLTILITICTGNFFKNKMCLSTSQSNQRNLSLKIVLFWSTISDDSNCSYNSTH